MTFFDKLEQQEQLTKEIHRIFNQFGTFITDCAHEAVEDVTKYYIGYDEVYECHCINVEQIHITYEYHDPYEVDYSTNSTISVPCEWLTLYTEGKLDELKQLVISAEQEYFDKEWELHRNYCKQAAEACGFIVEEK